MPELMLAAKPGAEALMKVKLPPLPGGIASDSPRLQDVSDKKHPDLSPRK